MRNRSWFVLAILLGGCGLFDKSSDDDDDDEDDDRDSGWVDDDIGGGVGGSSGGGSGEGDRVAPRIVDGYAGYSDNGALGLTALFTVEVEDPQDDVDGGLFHLTLNGGDTYDYPIGGEDVELRNGNVSLIFSNVSDPTPYDVEMSVTDAAGNRSNTWTGEMAW